MSTSEENPVLYVVKDGVAHITLNRPERRNAISIAVANRLHELWSIVDEDPEVRVVVLDAVDCGVFCAGMDLKESAQLREKEGKDLLTLMEDPFFERMRTIRKPVIAALTGHFTAAGMMIAMHADLRVALQGTTGGIAEVKRGRGTAFSPPLIWMMGLPMAMEMVLTGEPLPVERLREVGFINHIEADTAAVREKAFSLARCIAENAPLSVYAGKKTLMTALDVGCDEGLRLAKEIHTVVYESRDAQEGPLAFSEKRKPRWTGT